MTLRYDAAALVDELPEALAFRRSLGAFPTGVVAVCALVDDEPVGMSMNSFTSISLDPPLVSVSVARTSTSWPRLATAARIGVSVLGSDQGALCRKLSARAPDRLTDVDWHAEHDSAIFIAGAALWLSCSVHSAFDGGDHEVLLLEVHSMRLHEGVEPLVFHNGRFRALAED